MVVVGFSDAQGRSGFVKLWNVARPFHPLLPEGQFGRTLEEGQLRDLTNEERVAVWESLNADDDWRKQYDEHQQQRWHSFLLRSAASAEQAQAWYAVDFYLRKLMDDAPISDDSAADVQQREHLGLLKRLGNANQRMGNHREALAFHQQSIDGMLQSADTEPSDAETRRDLMLSYYRSGQAHQAQDEHDAAIESFQAAADVLRQMIAEELNVDEARQQLAAAEKAASAAEIARIALDDWDALMSQPADELPGLLEFRGIEMLRRSRFSEAARAATTLRELEHVDAETIYTAARLLSLCAAALDGRAEGGQSPSESEQREVWIDEALKSLSQAIAIGWQDYEHMRTNPDLQILRDLPAFERLLSDPPPPPLPASSRP